MMILVEVLLDWICEIKKDILSKGTFERDDSFQQHITHDPWPLFSTEFWRFPVA